MFAVNVIMSDVKVETWAVCSWTRHYQQLGYRLWSVSELATAMQKILA